MKTTLRIALFAILTFLIMLAVHTVAADELPDSPKPKAQPEMKLPARPEHRFYQGKPTRWILVAEASLWASDMAVTCRNLAHGGHESFLPTQSCAGAVGYTALFHAAGEGVAYILHRTHHHRLEQLPRLFLIQDSAHAIGYSATHGGAQ